MLKAEANKQTPTVLKDLTMPSNNSTEKNNLKIRKLAKCVTDFTFL